jgi:hypothetical protein
LYFALVRTKLGYASVACNSFTFTGSNELEGMQRKLAAIRHSRFFQDMKHYYGTILEKLNKQTLQIRRRHFDALFLMIFNDNIVPLFSKQSAFVLLFGIYVTLRGSVTPSTTAVQLDVFLLHMQFVNVGIFLITHFLL